MKIKTSKVLCKELAKRKLSCVDQINAIKMNCNEFENYVDYDSYRHENDYNYNTGEFSVIQVVYNYNCYAMDKYITTNDLLSIFKNCKEKTIECFSQEFNDYVAI